jgi:predicted nucleic acid-binding protein
MDGIKVLDTYVLWEIAMGNPKFIKYLDSNFLISDLILSEFYGIILREFNEQTANYWVLKFKCYSQQISLSILLKAVKFRREHAKKNLSFFDAAGYIFAKENNYMFVTGDKEFETLPNVEFIKK